MNIMATRLRYDRIMELDSQGTKMCGYMREMYEDGNTIRGYCSLIDKNCSYEKPTRTPTEDCIHYQKWVVKMEKEWNDRNRH